MSPTSFLLRFGATLWSDHSLWRLADASALAKLFNTFSNKKKNNLWSIIIQLERSIQITMFRHFDILYSSLISEFKSVGCALWHQWSFGIMDRRFLLKPGFPWSGYGIYSDIPRSSCPQGTTLRSAMRILSRNSTMCSSISVRIYTNDVIISHTQGSKRVVSFYRRL